ncbi:MAG: short-chain dehydrogenase [Bdellovibrionaceae bacterium]|nr:short-chain dehydrogenase [Pseudobdellovibrionaceae bacterium]|tara:strand:- start:35738 stop:36526 length:789 start_codon:yes stop_codon:yes gene_type:complete
MKTSNKKLLITGGNRGIGFALAKEFAQKNCSLVIVSRSGLSPDKLEILMEAGAEKVTSLNYDLSDEKSFDQFLEFLDSEKIEVDILINNAGLLSGGLFEEQKPEHIRKVLRVNTEASLLLTNFFLPKMLKQKSGYIVNNASVSGKMFLPTTNTYAASKAAIVGFTESLELELKNSGVKSLLLITPGVQTDMFEEINQVYKNVDYEAKNGMAPEKWAKLILDAIEHDQSVLTPNINDEAWWGLQINRLIPSLFKKIASSKFNR